MTLSRPRDRGRAGFVGLALLLAVLGSCSTANETEAPLALPDLSAADSFVRSQIRAADATAREMERAAAVGPEALAEAYGDVGKLFMAAAQVASAEPYLLRAQRLAPEDFRWSYYLGHLYRITGELEQSVVAFQNVLTVRPDDPVTLLSLGEVYLLQGRPEAAEPVFRQQRALQPDSVVAAVGLGRAALAANDYPRAVEHLEAAWGLSGETAVGIHYPLALAYRGLGEREKAETHMMQRADVAILPEDPLMEALAGLLESPRAYEQRGNRALTERDWPAAVAYFREGLALDPHDPTLRHRLGTALFQMGDSSGAAAQFEEVVRTSPDFALAHFSLGVLLEGSGLRSDAVERLEAAVRHDPTYVEARLGLASLLRREGRLEESLSQYEHVITQGVTGDPRIEEAPFGLAITLVHLGRYEEARDRLVDSMADYPSQAFFAHALARLLSGASFDAIRDGARAIEVLQTLPEAARRVDLGETMAMALAETGQLSQAVAWQQDAIDLAVQGGRRDLIAGMRAKLARYEDGLPWRSDNPVEFDPFLERAAGAIR